MKINAVTKTVFLDEKGEKFFGEGPARLLKEIEETGSLRSAAAGMNMAYTKALKIIRNAEAALGFPLTSRVTGGKSGGGSTLTPEGRDFLQKYDAYKKACSEAGGKLFREFFPRAGCVIMASGLGKRFGSNKLMAEFDGVPMIVKALEASEGLKDNRVVVTRHEDVAAVCRERGVAVVLHDLPHRSDTVRLGLEALGELDACLFMTGDQPLLKRETVAGITELWEQNRNCIVRPSHDGIPGSPVIFPHWAFEKLLSLPQGKGGGWVVNSHPDRVKELPVDNPYELMDADTEEALEILKQQLERT